MYVVNVNLGDQVHNLWWLKNKNKKKSYEKTVLEIFDGEFLKIWFTEYILKITYM